MLGSTLLGLLKSSKPGRITNSVPDGGFKVNTFPITSPSDSTLPAKVALAVATLEFSVGISSTPGFILAATVEIENSPIGTTASSAPVDAIPGFWKQIAGGGSFITMSKLPLEEVDISQIGSTIPHLIVLFSTKQHSRLVPLQVWNGSVPGQAGVSPLVQTGFPFIQNP